MALLPVFAFFQGRDGRPTGMETADSLNLDRMHNSLLGALQQGVLGLGTGGTYATLRRALQRLSVQCQQYCKRRRYKQYKPLSVTQTQFSLSPALVVSFLVTCCSYEELCLCPAPRVLPLWRPHKELIPRGMD